MTTIPYFTPVNYTRTQSCGEQALSLLSNYFYLGGTRATVAEKNTASLQSEKLPWKTIAWKVASYVLFFPVTFCLLAGYTILRSRYHFTVINGSYTKAPVPPRNASLTSPRIRKFSQDVIITIPEEMPEWISPPPSSPIQNKPSVFSLPTTILPPLPLITPPPQPESVPVLVEADTPMLTTVQKISEIVPTITQKTREEPFRKFSFTIHEKVYTLSSKDEMDQLAKTLGERVSQDHCLLQLRDVVGIGKKDVMLFHAALRNHCEVIPSTWDYIFEIVPEKINESNGVRTYRNGVTETVTQKEEYSWYGSRTYPNGVIEQGRFDGFRFIKGTRKEGERTLYRLPDIAIGSDHLDRHLLCADSGIPIVLQKKPGSEEYDFDYIPIQEDPTSALTAILKTERYCKDGPLTQLLSQKMYGAAYIQDLFKSDDIFSIQSYPLEILLDKIQKEKIVIDLHKKCPKTNKTLLDIHANKTRIIEKLLTIDPTLIQKGEGESILVRALRSGNPKGAQIILKQSLQNGIALSPREQFFADIALSEKFTASKEEVVKFSKEDQQIIYQLANIYSRLEIVKIMRELGFTRTDDLLMREGPSIFGCNMDALEMQETCKSFLQKLRSQGLFLSKKEFDTLDQTKYIEKGSDIGRILGRDYIAKKIQDLGLQHVKVPKKIIVLNDDTLDKITLRTSPLLDITTKDEITVYAERIERAGRKISPEEVAECIRLFEATGFSDIHWGNLMVAQDGIYIIDTEFTNFWVQRFYFEEGRQYAEMAKIIHVLPEEQQTAHIEALNEKLQDYRDHEEARNQARKVRGEKEKSALEKTGCMHGPCFTFPVDELLAPV